MLRGCAAVGLAAAIGAVMPGAAAFTPRVAAFPIVQPHAAFDQTTAPPPAGVQPGATAQPLVHPKIALIRHAAAASAPASPAPPPDPEVLGFAQSGEITSGAWRSDLRFGQLSTVAYFGVNVNSDGTLSTGDSGYSGWRSAELTSLMNTAHNAGDRVVLTIKAFNDAAIRGATGSEGARQNTIAAVVNELRSRGGDGVNVDYEGVSSDLAANFTTFVAELDNALVAQLPGQSYLTVDTYASAGLGGTMYDLAALTPHLDAFDLMGYGFASGSEASPTAPLHGDWYNVTQAVNDYQTKFGVPAHSLILGVPYYGFKWSVASPNPGNDGRQPGSGSQADTYAAALSDMSCALNLTQYWDATFAEPYATWWSPASGDPCGGNHNSWRELYYDNAQALGAKYDLVNAEGLRGIGIWALGYDSGSSDLWNEIAAKFSVTHAPSATVAALPGTENSTAFVVSWSNNPGSPPAARYVLWAQDGGGAWVRYLTTQATSTTAFGFPSHMYAFYVEAVGTNGYDSGGPAGAQATTTVSASATRSTPFTSLYGVNAVGTLGPGSSPPMPSNTLFTWDIVRGEALDATGQGGVILDGWGALHPFGDVASVSSDTFWPGWDIAVDVTANTANQGYILDGWGGVHTFSMNGAAQPPAVTALGFYWPGWRVTRALALFPDSSGGVVLDAFGGIHPFTVAGDTQPAAPSPPAAYWPGWPIARDIVIVPGSTYTSYSGYVLDGWGGIHPFGNAAKVSGGPWWPGWDIARRLVLLPGSSNAGYVVDGWGGLHPFGGASPVQATQYTPGWDLTRGLAVR
jgi:spore germination protein YaaH